MTDIINEFRSYNARVDVFDPWAKHEEAKHEYNIDTIAQPEPGNYDAIIIAVAHDEFREMGVAQIRALGKPDSVLFDVKYLFPAEQIDGRL